jgi:hypothetical protein
MGPCSRDGRFLRLTSDWRGLGNRQRQPTKLAAAGNTDTPCKLRLVARAFVANFEALRTVRSTTIAFDIAFRACEAVIRGTTSRGTSSALADGSGGVFDSHSHGRLR